MCDLGHLAPFTSLASVLQHPWQSKQAEAAFKLHIQKTCCFIYVVACCHLHLLIQKAEALFIQYQKTDLRFFVSWNHKRKLFQEQKPKLITTWSEAKVKKYAILINEDPQVLESIAYSNFDIHSLIPTGNL